MCEAVSKKNLAIPVRVLSYTALPLRSVISHYRLSTYYTRDFGFWIGDWGLGIGDCITTTLLPSYPPTPTTDSPFPSRFSEYFARHGRCGDDVGCKHHRVGDPRLDDYLLT
jgi:hypothetical protein